MTGRCLIGLEYSDGDDEGESIHRSVSGSEFERTCDRWLLVQDQNNPVAAGGPG
jgi:hypothetical protein